ncbi:hypothetical protein AB395_00005603 (plasmid) [Sinorhizobium fredii CCBAU 45436]|nr:hypothetical protein AB395_00005603 [Sinorhizobium fredii CCBAU 45436]
MEAAAAWCETVAAADRLSASAGYLHDADVGSVDRAMAATEGSNAARGVFMK